MGRRILFSPVGGTNPISLSNCQDGSMLHIARYYYPDEAILYMSKEIVRNEEKDGRYTKSLKRLSKDWDRDIEIKMIKRSDLVNVHEFDFFYKEFRKILLEIRSNLDEEDELIVNISSGTPAMKSGLLVLVTLGEIDCKVVQVFTPIKGMNEHEHKGFDLDVLWDLNEDNSNGINRCREVVCPTLTSLQKKEIIKRHIKNGYKIFDLGNISINNIYNTKNGFNGNIIEFSNTFDLVINEMFYKLYNYAKKDVK